MRIDVMKAFVDKWNVRAAPHTASEEEIRKVEADLGVSLPSTYSTLVKVFGELYTPNILDEIVDQNIEYPDVQNISLPQQAFTDTKLYVSGGMQGGYFGFASDCMGNMFCFRLKDCRHPVEDAPVWFFDHDFNEMYQLAGSLMEWLERYVQIERSANPH